MNLTEATFDVTFKTDFCLTLKDLVVIVERARTGRGQRTRALRTAADRTRTDNILLIFEHRKVFF